MNVTASSTAADDAQLARRLPPGLLRTVLAYEDELVELRAKQPDPNHARQARTERIAQAVQQAAAECRAWLEVNHPRFHASHIRNRIERAGPDRYGLTAVPDLRTIRRALKQLDVVATT